MGKVTGFKEYGRELPAKESPEIRIQNYNEFVGMFPEEKLNQQAARCMNCGIPFCHSGCPLGNVIPEFNDAVYKQNWEEAYAILSSTNNFPEFTGRICPAPCESACVLGINKPPVTIEEIEKHIIEIAYSKGLVKPHAPILRSGKTVAVVGSGPAGLAAAAQLNKAGHSVTVFERDDRPGGLLRYGIPDFKLEKWVIDRRVEILEQEGVKFICNTEIGKDITADELSRTFDAVVLAGGSTVPRNLPIEGRELKGVYFAMEFLKQQNKRVSNTEFSQESIMATDKNVVVIGGGDTGSDCVGTSNRHGAKSVLQFELMPQPPVNRTESMPWPTYPMVLKTTSSHEEGCERFWGISTKRFVGDDNGNLKGLIVVDVSWEKDIFGRPIKFAEVAGSERELPCELALLAMGFVHPEHEIAKQIGAELDERGNIKAAEGNYQTNVQNVFAAGDMRRGQSLVVWAISEGREAARKVDIFLTGKTSLASKDAESMFA
ncbi:glutamate synthase subunit beta [Rubrolithibacter danxiaensis]|uniref:glutamate synthase subunit beta n=1 Tax=Rubrolithibacter danxiaensis TaxID=3390805 RepID=UPI003BF8A448